MMKTIIAAFRDQSAADQAIAFLHDRGVTDIELMSQDKGDRSVTHLRELNVPDERAQRYADVIEHGSPVIAAHTERDAEMLAMELDRLGSLDLESEVPLGAEEREIAAEPAPVVEREAATEARAGTTEGGEAEVIEERVAIGTREVPRGGVRVRTFVAERPVREQVELTEERIDVQREPVNEPISTRAAEAAMGEEQFEVTARGEEVVVGKEARVVERVHVGKTPETRTETVEATERRQDVEVEPIEKTETTTTTEPGPGQRSRR